MSYVCTALGETPPDCSDAESTPSRATIGSQLLRMLPRGPLWDFREQVMQPAFWRGAAEALAIWYARATEVTLASTVVTAPAEFLDDWETELGVPGPCMQPLVDNQVRRKRLRIARQPGGATAAYFICLASRYGYMIDIDDDLPPFECAASECGRHGLGDDEDLFIVTSLTTDDIIWMQCGASELGTIGLGAFPVAEDLECIIRRNKPAHTNVWFRYARPTADSDLITLDQTDITIDTEPVEI